MARVGAHLDDCLDFRPVVAGNHHHRIVRHPEAFDGLHHFAHNVVELMNEIPVRPRFCSALKLLRRERGQMHRIHGVQKKEGFFRMALGVLLKKLAAFLTKDHVQFFEIVVRRDHAGAVIKSIRMLGQF